MADPLAPQWRIEKLSPNHHRAGFACGHPSLDTFLKQFAGQNERSGVSQTFVAVHPGQLDVLGFYSLSAGNIEFDNLTDPQRKRLPRYPVPVAHLGRLAVDLRARGQRLGELLLLDVLARITGAADSIGIHAVEVVAIDNAAATFYLKYGFAPLRDDPHHLYLPMKTVRKLGLA